MPDRVANLTVAAQRPPGVPLLRRVPARLLHGFILQQPFGHAARRRAHRPAVFGERCRGEPRGDEQTREKPRAYTTSIARRAPIGRATPKLWCWPRARSNPRGFCSTPARRAFPTGVGNSTSQLGHYLMDHFTLEGAGGFIRHFKSSQREPTRHAVRVPDRQVRQHGQQTSTRISCADIASTATAARNFTAMRSAFRASARTGAAGCARRFRTISGLRHRASACRATTTTSELDPEKKDAWGIPALHIQASYGENEHAMAKAMRHDVLEIIDAMKVEKPRPPGES